MAPAASVRSPVCARGRAGAGWEDLERRLEVALAGLARQLGRRPESLRALLSVPRARALLRDMERRLGPLAGRRILEVGSGCGLALALANADLQADAWGVDPAQAGYNGVSAIAHEVLARCGVSPARLLCAAGEALPLPSARFDVVCSFYALEHVQDLARVVGEAARVLRPGGYLYLVAPNYGSVWEGHYGIPWIPYLPRPAARLYVRLLGRSAAPLEDISFLTVGKVAAALAKTPRIRVEGLGLREFEARLCAGSVADLDTARWVAPLLRLTRAPAAARLAAAAAGWLRLWTPLVVVARREGREGREGRDGRDGREGQDGYAG